MAGQIAPIYQQRWVAFRQAHPPHCHADPRLSAHFAHLTATYTEPHRHYLTHLDHMFAVAQPFAAQATNGSALQLAIWYHDAVYNPHAADNEARSAELAMQHLTELALPPETIATVHELILATRTHIPPPRSCSMPTSPSSPPTPANTMPTLPPFGPNMPMSPKMPFATVAALCWNNSSSAHVYSTPAIFTPGSIHRPAPTCGVKSRRSPINQM